MTTWRDELAVIRRYLRDPDGHIWSSGALLRLYNDAQNYLSVRFPLLSRTVQVVKVPPVFQASYTEEWERAYAGSSDGEVYQIGIPYDPEDMQATQVWEAEELAGASSTTVSTGACVTQPWEHWMTAGGANAPPPIELPPSLSRACFMAYDRDVVSPTSRREVMSTDPAWKIQGGSPIEYYRDSKDENRVYLYPIPGSVDWQDTESGEIEDPDDADYADTSIDIDNNLLVVFDSRPTDIGELTDEPYLKSYLLKYIRYEVIAQAYRSNTDGRIQSLADYWDTRAKIGHELIRLYLRNRRQDRDYRLETPGPPARQWRHPRLPDHYPLVG